jgi:dTDP-L-rhamnose 4-epimerase
MGERILVTGGAGFIGSHLVDALLSRGAEVTVLDSLDPQIHTDGAPPDYLNHEAAFVRADIRDRTRLVALIRQADVVFHQAAAVGVGQSMYEVERYCDVNARGTSVLLDVLANERHGVRKLIVASSMSIYGEGCYRCPQHGYTASWQRPDEQLLAHDWEPHCPTCGAELVATPTPETAPMHAPNVYALTKKMQEELVLNVCSAYGLPAVALRYFNVYGTRQSLSNPYTGVAAIFMSRLMNGKAPMIFEDGLQSRDFVSVHDIVRANLAALDSAGADYRALNVGTGRACSVLELARLLGHILGVEVEPQVTGEYRRGDIRSCVADTRSATRALGFEASVALEDGLRELCDWSAHAEAVDRVETATRELISRGLVR